MRHSDLSLEELIAKSLDRPVPEPVRAIANHAARQFGKGEAAILAYGSCLRGTSTDESLVDLYFLTHSLADVSNNPLSRIGCALLPPNVYYVEMTHEGSRLRAKCAVMQLRQFAAGMKQSHSNPYFWARFSQPTALVLAANAEDRQIVVAAIADAARTMFANAKALAQPNDDALTIWQRGFAATYGTELRSESAGRSHDIVAANANYYQSMARLLGHLEPHTANWPARNFAGKFYSIGRLLKAAFTFSGGADYLAWKIERHSGQKIALTDWQRRHPIMAGIVLLPRLLKKGAVR
jgi:hypothetical protein